MLPCRHLFHYHCIDNRINLHSPVRIIFSSNNKQECPICLVNLDQFNPDRVSYESINVDNEHFFSEHINRKQEMVQKTSLHKYGLAHMRKTTDLGEIAKNLVDKEEQKWGSQLVYQEYIPLKIVRLEYQSPDKMHKRSRSFQKSVSRSSDFFNFQDINESFYSQMQDWDQLAAKGGQNSIFKQNTLQIDKREQLDIEQQAGCQRAQDNMQQVIENSPRSNNQVNQSNAQPTAKPPRYTHQSNNQGIQQYSLSTDLEANIRQSIQINGDDQISQPHLIYYQVTTAAQGHIKRNNAQKPIINHITSSQMITHTPGYSVSSSIPICQPQASSILQLSTTFQGRTSSSKFGPEDLRNQQNLSDDQSNDQSIQQFRDQARQSSPIALKAQKGKLFDFKSILRKLISSKGRGSKQMNTIGISPQQSFQQQ
ncbi:hypothetical protein FGO68_gene17721 [Halteria grandinella]|uniref:Uncharacterized protein n=1 Tax=Halteria grandinella TaxID=5974 RepID=A0A8J8T6Q3_HALGN|nr:hypothetical protein FGO68_gene17721 [Halteria grandinella]